MTLLHSLRDAIATCLFLVGLPWLMLAGVTSVIWCPVLWVVCLVMAGRATP